MLDLSKTSHLYINEGNPKVTTQKGAINSNKETSYSKRDPTSKSISYEVLRARRLMSANINERSGSPLHFKNSQKLKSIQYSSINNNNTNNNNNNNINSSLPKISTYRPYPQQRNSIQNTMMALTSDRLYDSLGSRRNTRDILGPMWYHPTVTRKILRQLENQAYTSHERTLQWLEHQTNDE